jgi:D-alanyl-D-alanine carboxypeptidase
MLVAVIIAMFIGMGSSVVNAADASWTFPLSEETMADPDGFLTLVNTDHLLTSDDKPADLVNIAARKTTSDAVQLRAPVSEALSALFDAAKSDGLTLYAHSGYRSYQTQKVMFANRLARVGYDDKLVQQAGASDHQTGMGVDVINKALIGQRFGASFADTKEGRWLAEHCAEYGFVIRYPLGKEDITGISYEPWHLRYVSDEAAWYLTDNEITLEELWEQWDAYQAGTFEFGGNDAQGVIQDGAVVVEDGALDVEP